MPSDIKIVSMIPPSQRMWAITEEEVTQADGTTKKEQFCDSIDFLVVVEHRHDKSPWTTVEVMSLNWLKDEYIEDVAHKISLEKFGLKFIIRESDVDFRQKYVSLISTLENR